MALSKDDVARIAHLARIEITSEQAAETLAQLNDIFGMIEKMQRVPTDGIEPMSHPQEVMQPLRADAVTESDLREKFQSIAPEIEDGLYLVPKVIE